MQNAKIIGEPTTIDGSSLPKHSTTPIERKPKKETEQPPMPLEEAARIIVSDDGHVPNTMAILSSVYSNQLMQCIEAGEFNKRNKKTIARAYQTLAANVCAIQIDELGRFEPAIDFSELQGVHVFDGAENGVEKCRACNGLGGLIMFDKKPKTVQCLKCKTVSLTLDGKHIVIDDKTLTVDGVDKSNDRRYKWLFGRKVEKCARCDGSSRYRDESKGKNLIINVKCTTCNGQRYQEDIEGSQVIAKCKTCHGKQKLKIAVLTGSVKSITPCKTCDGLGFVKPPPGLANPVLSRDLGSAISSTL